MASRVVVSLRIKASPQRTFAAFTEEIGAWWRPNGIFPFTQGTPGVLSFEGEAGGRLIETRAQGEIFEIGRISAWTPPHGLRFSWRQDTFSTGQETEVEVRFEAVGDQTRVTVEHTGWDSVPARHVARHGFPDAVFLRRHGEWWQILLADLAACVATDRKD